MCMCVCVNACTFQGVQRETEYMKIRENFEKELWMQILWYEDVPEEQIQMTCGGGVLA